MNAAIDELGRRFWAYRLDTDVFACLESGTPVSRLRAVTPEERAADAAFARETMGALEAIDAQALEEQDALTAAVLRAAARDTLDAEPFYWHERRLGPYAEPFQWLAPAFTTFGFASRADADRYRSLLEDAANLAGSLADFARGQAVRGLAMPHVEIDAAVAHYCAHATPEASAYFIPSLERLSALPDEAARELRENAERAVRDRILPALQRLTGELDGPYREAAASGAGLGHYKDGEAFYASLIRRNTSLDLTADRIHVTGITELERIGEELERIRERVGFAGDAAAFHAHLRADTRFFAADADEMLAKLESYSQRAAQAVPAFFGALPRAPWQIRPLPDALAKAQTFGYFQPPTAGEPFGTYFFNGSHPETTSLISAAALVLHELVPGHHLQIALQMENETLPPVRRYASNTAFCEGYADYAAQLGFEMGIYADPYEEAGRLMQDAFMSARLVVDTGMNVLGWSLEQARAFMAAQTMLSEKEIETETLRYSCDLPGQALAYKIGELAILQTRDRAKERYGARFDVRAFHDWLLGNGSVPLEALG